MSIRQTKIRKLLLDRRDKVLSNVMLQIELLIIVPLLCCRVPAYRTHVDHAVAELNKRASLHWDI